MGLYIAEQFGEEVSGWYDNMLSITRVSN